MNELTNMPGGDDGPEAADGERADERPRGGPRRPRQRRIPSVEECLDAMAKLAGAVAMGFVSPAQANAMRGSYAEILRHHRQSQDRHGGPALSNADVVELLRRDPLMLSTLEPFLSDEQLDMVMRHAAGPEREQT